MAMQERIGEAQREMIRLKKNKNKFYDKIKNDPFTKSDRIPSGQIFQNYYARNVSNRKNSSLFVSDERKAPVKVF